MKKRRTRPRASWLHRVTLFPLARHCALLLDTNTCDKEGGMRVRVRLCLLLGLLVGTVTALLDRFDEHLALRPLADGRLHTLFSFVLQSNDEDSSSVPIYSTVPRSLIHLAKASDAEEVHLAINAGRWDYQKWGEPGAEEMVGNGAEVWAKLRHHDASSNRQKAPK